MAASCSNLSSYFWSESSGWSSWSSSVKFTSYSVSWSVDSNQGWFFSEFSREIGVSELSGVETSWFGTSSNLLWHESSAWSATGQASSVATAGTSSWSSAEWSGAWTSSSSLSIGSSTFYSSTWWAGSFSYDVSNSSSVDAYLIGQSASSSGVMVDTTGSESQIGYVPVAASSLVGASEESCWTSTSSYSIISWSKSSSASVSGSSSASCSLSWASSCNKYWSSSSVSDGWSSSHIGG